MESSFESWAGFGIARGVYLGGGCPPMPWAHRFSGPQEQQPWDKSLLLGGAAVVPATATVSDTVSNSHTHMHTHTRHGHTATATVFGHRVQAHRQVSGYRGRDTLSDHAVSRHRGFRVWQYNGVRHGVLVWGGWAFRACCGNLPVSATHAGVCCPCCPWVCAPQLCCVFVYRCKGLSSGRVMVLIPTPPGHTTL